MLIKHYENESNIYNFNKDMFIFGNIKHIAPTTLKRKLEIAINKSGVKPLTPHGFRHSHATHLRKLGCSYEAIAKRLGDTMDVIKSVYCHVDEEEYSGVINLLNNFKNKR